MNSVQGADPPNSQHEPYTDSIEKVNAKSRWVKSLSIDLRYQISDLSRSASDAERFSDLYLRSLGRSTTQIARVPRN